MRVRRVFFVALLMALSPAVRADEPAADLYANQPNSYAAPAAVAGTPIEFEVRVIEVNHAKLREIGFDLDPKSLHTRELPLDSKKSNGLIGFLEALGQQGLVPQELTCSQTTPEGKALETTLRWRDRAHGEWHQVQLRVMPTLVNQVSLSVDVQCRAWATQSSDTAESTPMPQVAFDAKDRQSGEYLAFATRIKARAGQEDREGLSVFVLLTPKWGTTVAVSEKHACLEKFSTEDVSAAEKAGGTECRPELLAPVNVLDAEGTVPCCRQGLPTVFRGQSARLADREPRRLFADVEQVKQSDTATEYGLLRAAYFLAEQIPKEAKAQAAEYFEVEPPAEKLRSEWKNAKPEGTQRIGVRLAVPVEPPKATTVAPWNAVMYFFTPVER